MAAHIAPGGASYGNLNSTLADGVYPDVVRKNSLSIQEMSGFSGSVTRSNGEANRVFHVSGEPNALVARKALFDAGDDGELADLYEFDDLNLQTVSYERVSPTVWAMDCVYNDDPLVGNIKVSISTTGATVKTYQANNERVYPGFALEDPSLPFNATTNPLVAMKTPWYRGAIDVQFEGDRLVPRGADIVIPVLRINVTGRIAYEYIGTEFEYSKKLGLLTGTVNSNQEFATSDGLGGFIAGTGFAPGELLFLGADGDIIADKDPLLTFSFLASPNLDGVTVGNSPNVVKKGHEFGWFSFAQALDDQAGPTDDGAAGGNTKRGVIIADGFHVNTLYAGAGWDDLALSKAPT